MSMYNVVFYCCLCLICQTSSQITAKTDRNYILCENQRSPILACSTKQIIIIIDAIYGRTDSRVCPHDSVKSTVSYSCNRTDSSRVASNCNFNQACLPQSSNLDKDPCKGIYKYLNVTYKCIEDTCIGTTCVNDVYCTHDGDRRRCVCPSELTETECNYEDACMGTTCVNGAYCIDGGENSRCVCPSQFTEIKCIYEDIPPDYLNRMISFKTANKTNDLALLNLKKCVKAKEGFLKFRVLSSGNINITMVDSSIEKQIVTIEIVINKTYITVIYVRFDENGKNKTIINNVGVSCNTCSNLTINWRDGILKLGTMFDDNLVKPVFTVIFKIHDIHLSSAVEADWILNFFEPGLDQVKQTNEGCKDILRISACKGESQTCNHCKYSNIGMDINALCVNKTGNLIEFFDKNCENLHDQLTIWHEIHDNILTESDMNNNQETKTSEIIGLAVGISVSVGVIIVIACVLIFLRKKKRSPKKESTQTSTNGQDYIGNQNIAMRWSGDSPEYTDMKVRRESHKYGELKSVSEATGDSCYDVIDANEHPRKTKVFSVEQGIFQNDSPSRSCQEYAMLDPSEKWKTESNTTSYHDTACDDYTVFEAEEGKNSHPVYPPSNQFDKGLNTYQTKNNEKKWNNTYDYFCGDKTDDDYNIPMKM